MNAGYHFVLSAVILYCSSCSAIRHSGTHGLQDGYFVLKTGTVSSKKVYAVVTEDSLAIHSLLKNTGQPEAVASMKFDISGVTSDHSFQSLRLVKRSLDLDLGTVLFKYRFRNQTLPNQLSTNLNFAFYCGYRHDYFTFHVKTDPLKKNKKVIRHFEFDAGVFAGFGSTPMNPSVTQNSISEEYDGIVFQKGVAFFVGSKSFTAGIGIGTDGLMDRNKRYWLYQEKPWVGVMIGLNLTD